MRYLLFIFLFCLVTKITGQELMKHKEGVVSYKSSQNVYVKYETTDGIAIGDTLFVQEVGQLVPVLEVKHISSISVVGVPISSIIVHVADMVLARDKTSRHVVPDTSGEKTISALQAIDSGTQIPEKVHSEPDRKEDIRGRLAVGSYTYFSNTQAENSQRMRYTFSLHARNITDSRFSAESYIIFRHKSHEWDEVKENIARALKVYSFAVKYEPDDVTQILFGRKINSHVSNIGAMDGVQLDRKFGNITVGAMAGSRPDMKDYSLDLDLFQYGGFISHELNTKKGYMQTSLAMLEQKNHGRTDRRFAYFQHTNSLLKNLHLFYSVELDLFKVENDIPASTISPTSLYVSLRYRASRKLSLSASFDKRKNVIYYESYKSFIDQLIEQETRQGLRFRFNYRPIKFVTLGSSVGYRFQKGNSNQSKNLYSFLTFSRVPFLKMSATISSTLLETSYLKGSIFGMRLSKDLFKGKLFTELNYRIVNYEYGGSDSKLNQRIGGANLSWRIKRRLSLSVDYEGTFEKTRTLNRVYVNVIQRF